MEAQLPGGVHVGPAPQNQQLLLTPASLQLAQLQAQLTLQRLKLAQGGNTAAAAASVLNQVLSNVAMSQPLFNQLRTSAMVATPPGGIPAGMLGFPSSLGCSGFNQNPGRGNNHGGGGKAGQQGGEFGQKYPCDTDRRVHYNLGTSAASGAAGEGQYAGINSQAKNNFYGSEAAGFGGGEQNMTVYPSSGQKEPWSAPSNMSHSGMAAMGSDSAPTAWTPAGQPMQSRTELYDPEEPTLDPKFNPTSGASSFGSSGMQAYGGYQLAHGGEEGSGTRTLQPYQVNDFHAVTPTQLPHQCSICDKKVYNLKVSG